MVQNMSSKKRLISDPAMEPWPIAVSIGIRRTMLRAGPRGGFMSLVASPASTDSVAREMRKIFHNCSSDPADVRHLSTMAFESERYSRAWGFALIWGTFEPVTAVFPLLRLSILAFAY